MKKISDGYYWVICKEIDSKPVIAEYCDDEWFFCGFSKAFSNNDIDTIGDNIEEPFAK
ncbi:hypothetical protein [Aliiglaciecola sp. NS0011-25]|uniref:hypothetical protein n=1 Tax=Aliiglaciecola sp. NS0011-25 TaxID=3127654 RepID=UPI003108C25A